MSTYFSALDIVLNNKKNTFIEVQKKDEVYVAELKVAGQQDNNKVLRSVKSENSAFEALNKLQNSWCGVNEFPNARFSPYEIYKLNFIDYLFIHPAKFFARSSSENRCIDLKTDMKSNITESFKKIHETLIELEYAK